jgi:hypothetical protein
MRRFLVLLISTVLALTATAGPVAAVTDGGPDNGAHPYVGLAVFYDAEGNPMHRCSGTLLSPRIFLTAGHCTAGTTSADIWFDEYVTRDLGYPFEGPYSGTPYTHPNFVWSIPNTSDVGVIVIEGKPANGFGSGQLPELGTLDSLATQRGQQDVWFDVVGYGLQQIKPTELAETSRLQASVQLVNLQSALTDGYNIHHTNAPGTGGGTCFGDSGGPVFLSGTNVIVGITSFGLNGNCVGGGFAYRTDIANTLDWVWSFF